MITIQTVMLVALGFLSAGLLTLLLAPAFWNRAVRLTTKRLKDAMPVSEAEVRADRDRMRAEFAMQLYRLEQHVDQSRAAAARHMIDLSRRDANIGTLESSIRRLEVNLEETQNARNVLEQTITDRLPRIEQRLGEAKQLLAQRDQEINALKGAGERQRLALDEATTVHSQQQAAIERLNGKLAAAGAVNSGAIADPRFDGEVALRTEIEDLRARSRDQASLIERMQMGAAAHFNGSGAAAPDESMTPEAEIDRLRRALFDAQVALKATRDPGIATAVDPAGAKELWELRARSEDQGIEITRLTAALQTYEAGESDAAGTMRDSKLALKARLSAAQALADQQGEAVKRLRAELAASNERMARQATHFTVELRRLGAGTLPTQIPTGAAPRRAANGNGNGRRSLTERASRARQEAPGNGTDPAMAGEASGSGATPHAVAPAALPESAARALPAPADMAPAAPVAASLEPPVEAGGKRPRLLDRITSLSNP